MLGGCCTRVLSAVLNKSWKEHPTIYIYIYIYASGVMVIVYLMVHGVIKTRGNWLGRNSINSTKTLSGKEGTDINGVRYKKSAQIKITSPRGTLVNSEAISKDTMKWVNTKRELTNNVRKSKWIVHTKSWVKC